MSMMVLFVCTGKSNRLTTKGGLYWQDGDSGEGGAVCWFCTA